MIEIAHTAAMERAIRVAHEERGAAFANFWRGVFSFLPKIGSATRPQAMPVGHA